MDPPLDFSGLDLELIPLKNQGAAEQCEDLCTVVAFPEGTDYSGPEWELVRSHVVGCWMNKDRTKKKSIQHNPS